MVVMFFGDGLLSSRSLPSLVRDAPQNITTIDKTILVNLIWILTGSLLLLNPVFAVIASRRRSNPDNRSQKKQNSCNK